ncbi:1-acyl-sn-glycerol-3-phosphate acyltransferase, partial [Streptomyces anulatus]|uniref:1-acyl-sn-glycerol-3-phosphate acyltransferase n=1 Tax=Streptomyces anulatus TaxID=1892 RepID=UPI00341AF96B
MTPITGARPAGEPAGEPGDGAADGSSGASAHEPSAGPAPGGDSPYGHGRSAQESSRESPRDGGRDLAELLAFLRRRVTGQYDVDEFGFDPELTDKVLLELIRPLYRHWFRVETVGMENVPGDSGALVVANHSGTIPLDALMLQVALHDEHPDRRAIRLLGADLVYQLPVLGHLSRKTGHTLACREDADR